MVVTHFGQTDIVDKLLQDKYCKINAESTPGQTAIFFATHNGYLNIVDKLIINGNDK